jgi:alpha-L-fucosidase
LDWHYPSSNWSAYKPYYYKQIKELLTNYGKIGYLWFDGEWVGEWNDGEAEELYKYVVGLDPKIITNNPKRKSSSAYGDFGLDEENYTPSGDDWYKTGLWERDRLVQEGTWGYKSWANWKTPKALIQDMIDAASKNMNYCLNIGPKADGTFPQEAMNILAEFGKWLGPNGAAIYKTNGFVSDFATNVTALATRKTDKSAYYLHITDWTENTMTITTALDITQVTSLNPLIDLGVPSVSRNAGTTTITMNRPATLDPYATVVKLVTRDEQEKFDACVSP